MGIWMGLVPEVDLVMNQKKQKNVEKIALLSEFMDNIENGIH